MGGRPRANRPTITHDTKITTLAWSTIELEEDEEEEDFVIDGCTLVAHWLNSLTPNCLEQNMVTNIVAPANTLQWCSFLSLPYFLDLHGPQYQAALVPLLLP